MSGFFEINKRGSHYYFWLKAGNGEKMLRSETYLSLKDCENCIKSIRLNIEDDAVYDKKRSTDGRHYFYLKCPEGKIIATSGLYESSLGIEQGIRVVKTIAPKAVIYDLTGQHEG